MSHIYTHVVPHNVRGILRICTWYWRSVDNVLGNSNLAREMQPVTDWLDAIEDEERRCEL